MKLWVTPKGDRWLCDECEEDFEKEIAGAEHALLPFADYHPVSYLLETIEYVKREISKLVTS